MDYGNGVYYFDKSDFGNSLSTFIGTHPELEFVTIETNNRGYGHTDGYFVTFKPRPTEAIAQNQSAGR